MIPIELDVSGCDVLRSLVAIGSLLARMLLPCLVELGGTVDALVIGFLRLPVRLDAIRAASINNLSDLHLRF